MTIRIGITEHGDAGLDLAWANNIVTSGPDKIDGAILITKNVSQKFAEKLFELRRAGFPFIVHATCTGWGGTRMEPYVPTPELQLNAVACLINAGVPAENIVIRVDPIIPTTEGLKRLEHVLEHAKGLGLIPRCRVRVSVMDQYRHVQDRFRALGFPILYGGKFYAGSADFQAVDTVLRYHGDRYETCAEPWLQGDIYEHVGCLSKKDLDIMGIPMPDNLTLNPQNRQGCQCLSCKQELFSRNQRHPCPHQCAYCFWKD